MFAGKSFAVTGATSGIGREISIRLANEGATVFICGRRKELLKALVSEYPTMKATGLDVTDWNAVDQWIDSIDELDGLVNNAGVLILEPCHQISKECLESTISTNLIAPIHLTQAFSKKLIEKNRSGCIVNMSSIGGIRAGPGAMTYCSSKAALSQMTRSAAFELGPYNIRVNAVCPTLVETPMTVRYFNVEEITKYGEITPLRKLPTTYDIVDATIFLLSDKAKMISGQRLYVDSGITLSKMFWNPESS